MINLKVGNKRIGPLIGRHPWVFSQAIIGLPDGIPYGEPVRLTDERGSFLAAGYFNSYSQIAVRIWGFEDDEQVDADFFANRIESAYEIRKRYLDGSLTDSFRVVNGENDLLPGLIVDKYADHLVVQFHSRGIERWRGEIIDALVKTLAPQGIYERSDVSSRRTEEQSGQSRTLYGDVPDIITMRENGLMFLADIKKGQKTGFFLDQRDKRLALMRYASGQSVLNCFSYTGAFGVYALKAGAQKVVNVDVSETALSLAKENVRINGFDINKCEFAKDDAKQYLRDNKARFDVIVLDPPAFIKDRKKKKEGIHGYKTINEYAMKAVNEGGILLSCSCSAHLTLQEFRYLISESGGRTKKTLRILETFTHGLDHPELAAYTEGEYLKCFIVHVNS